MNERPFGLKGVFAAGAGAASLAAGLGTVGAQDEDDDVEVGGPGEDPVVTSGDVTASVVDGEATVVFVEEDEEDEAAEGDTAEEDEAAEEETVEEDDDEVSLISVDGGTAISDASGGDDNFAFVS